MWSLKSCVRNTHTNSCTTMRPHSLLLPLNCFSSAQSSAGAISRVSRQRLCRTAEKNCRESKSAVCWKSMVISPRAMAVSVCRKPPVCAKGSSSERADSSAALSKADTMVLMPLESDSALLLDSPDSADAPAVKTAARTQAATTAPARRAMRWRAAAPARRTPLSAQGLPPARPGTSALQSPAGATARRF